MIHIWVHVWATKWFKDMQTEAIRLTKVLAWRMDAAASAEQEISALTTHTHTTTKRKRENRQDAATDEMIHWGHWTWWQSSSERARWGREMYGKCLQTFAWNQQINKARTVRPTRDNGGETWRASEKNFVWQVKWKFLHKSKLKVLKIAKGLKLNFTILTSAKGCSRGRSKESSLFFFWLCYLGNPSYSHFPHPSCATVKRVRLTFMRFCCSCFAGLYFYLLVGFCVFCVWRSHSFSFVVFALWANFWLLVGFQICGKSEVRRKLNELAPALGASAASHCPSAFPCCLSVCASFIYLHAVCFSASSPQHFHAFFCLWFCIWRYVFFSLCPFTHFSLRFPVFFMV